MQASRTPWSRPRTLVYVATVAAFTYGLYVLFGVGAVRLVDGASRRLPSPAMDESRWKAMTGMVSGQQVGWCTAIVRRLERTLRETLGTNAPDLTLAFFQDGLERTGDPGPVLRGCFVDAAAGRFDVDLAFLTRVRIRTEPHGEVGVSYVLARGVAERYVRTTPELWLDAGGAPLAIPAAERPLRERLLVDFVAGLLLRRLMAAEQQPLPEAATAKALEIVRFVATDLDREVKPRGWSTRSDLLLGTAQQSHAWFRAAYEGADLAEGRRRLGAPLE